MELKDITGKSILLGLSLYEDETHLVRFTQSLCQSLRAKLLLTHILKPFHYYAYAGEAPVFPLDTYGPIMDELDEENAQKLLSKIQEGLDVESDIIVKRDSLIEGIEEVAEKGKAGLIVLGSNYSNSVWQGLSTSISLMRGSSFPVLVVPQGCDQITKPDLTIYCGDDLTDSCNSIMSYARDLALALKADHLLHYHIHDMSEQDIKRITDHIKNAVILGKMPEEELSKVETYRERVIEQTLEQLKIRYERLQGAESLNVERNVLFGEAAEELTKLISKDDKPKLLIFGKHHIFRPESLSLGRLPYPTMLELGAAVMVCPSDS
ncbi:universal stress protein [Pseudobacteriovorax antillogorgiicola]|uniref:Nucleotide-binding universal stress protein, UspA family n=1 Tax=Pseudobacteriovorax antillogorgiicola TaxID=1513793 RepID=A0A1Y6BSI5_9BACT|nr:universal stress protein [Pseudobacteriovorax antillogorgiicola]TCS53070.1 nucleotide-binding universal stress UspA family protein [Pseudobacteriovorax antillogorgiicola]SMF26277.1 Nucleotide-binding universal stress protein, UspA family [Pseudobacteriovorax antillogorgiicola]